MAFLPTVALFLAVAVAEEPVEEPVVDEVAEEVEEDTADEEEADEEVDGAGSFAECAKNTTWAEEDASQGYTLDASTTCNDVHPKDCLKHPDIAMCCPDECNKEKICSGFESPEGADLLTCLNDVRFRGTNWWDSLNPTYSSLWDWKASHGACPELLANPEATGDYSEINLCCNASSTARRLADDAEAEAEAEAEADDAADETAKLGGGMYPLSTGEELVSKMCNGASSTSTDSASTATEETKGESTDGTDTTTNSASTFGFTALALMLVTA